MKLIRINPRISLQFASPHHEKCHETLDTSCNKVNQSKYYLSTVITHIKRRLYISLKDSDTISISSFSAKTISSVLVTFRLDKIHSWKLASPHQIIIKKDVLFNHYPTIDYFKSRLNSYTSNNCRKFHFDLQLDKNI
jgi:hypothetical protein